ADRFGAPVAMTIAGDYRHFLHEPIVAHIRPAALDFGIVQRQVRQLILAVPPNKLLDLPRANAAFAVVDYHVGIRTVSRRGESRVGNFFSLRHARERGSLAKWRRQIPNSAIYTTKVYSSRNATLSAGFRTIGTSVPSQPAN